MLSLVSLLTISFLLYAGCSKPDMTRDMPKTLEQVPADTPGPPVAEHPGTEEPAKPGAGQNAGVEPEKATGPSAIDFAVPEIRPPEGNEIKLDQTLLALVRAQRQGGVDAVKAMVAEGRVELEAEDRVRVEITVTAETVAAEVAERIAAAGGEVTTVFHNRVYALVPLADVETLTTVESVWNMAVPQVVASPLDVSR